MKLPGSRPDVIRNKSLSGPSPVGGSFGGTDSQRVMSLDDFELQAAHYNMACAHARLGNLDEVRPASPSKDEVLLTGFANSPFGSYLSIALFMFFLTDLFLIFICICFLFH